MNRSYFLAPAGAATRGRVRMFWTLFANLRGGGKEAKALPLLGKNPGLIWLYSAVVVPGLYLDVNSSVLCIVS